MTVSSRRPPARRVRALVALGLAVLGVVLLWASLGGPAAPDPVPVGAPALESAPPSSPAPTGVSPSRAATSKHPADVRDRTTGLVLPESPPVAVSIPSIGVRSRLVDLGLDADRVMEVPRDPALAGWFTGSPTPGALGPAVIAGHVTWDRAPAVFRRLGALRRGDRVAVTRKDGRTAVFTVDRVARFSKSRFPTRDVYGTIDHAGLRLITCGGTYDTVHHRYLDNVVVFARLTGVRRAP